MSSLYSGFSESFFTSTGFFNPEWYASQYQDVGISGLKPFDHYAKYGRFMGRQPSLYFDVEYYLKQVAASGVNAADVLQHYLTKGKKEHYLPNRNNILPKVRRSSNSRVDFLIEKIWAGYSNVALPELKSLVDNSVLNQQDSKKAAQELGVWYYVAGDFSLSLNYLHKAKSLYKKYGKPHVVIEAQCLIKLGRLNEAKLLVEGGVAKIGNNADFYLLLSSIYGLLGDEERQLNHLNLMLAESGLSRIELNNPESPISFLNIVAERDEAGSFVDLAKPKISIVVPIYNAEKTIRHSVNSLLNQTWSNIELILVDDCSNDGTLKILNEIASTDHRVKVIAQKINQGAYPARNEGLRHVTGDYISIHDSDDWSHPQKYEIQMGALMADSSAIAVMSHWARVDDQMHAVGTWRPNGSLFSLNFSSMTFKSSVLDVLGAWENVLVSGDAEFKFRLEKYYGKNSVIKIPKQYVLSFSLSREDSLTRTKATHVSTINYGMRWNYSNLYRHLHAQPEFIANPKQFSASGKAPRLRSNQRNLDNASYDIVFVSDFALKGGAFVSTYNYVLAACRQGLKVGVVHWRKYELSSRSSINEKLISLMYQYNIDLLSPGDMAQASLVVIGYPAILHDVPDSLPEINTSSVVVVVNQYADRLEDGGDPQYSPPIADKNILEWLGQRALWVPISGWVKDLISSDSRYARVGEDIWTPLLNTSVWPTRDGIWRGATRIRPKVGKHGRDAYTKWPSTKRMIEQAYGVGANWDMQFKGGVDCAVEVLGYIPDNWTVKGFSSENTRSFLEDLDFYVHFPHESYIEEFGRAVMEAMSLGIPAILPPKFEKTFGDAAIYAQPAQVHTVVEKLWRDESSYYMAAFRAKNFVEKQCDGDLFLGRVEQYVS